MADDPFALFDAWYAEARETFVFFIHGGKVRAPAAAQELIKRIG